MVKNSEDLRHPTFRYAHKRSPLQSIQYTPCVNCSVSNNLNAAVVTGQLSLRSDLLTAWTPCSSKNVSSSPVSKLALGSPAGTWGVKRPEHETLQLHHPVPKLMNGATPPRGSVALLYRREGRVFDSRSFHWNFSLSYSFRPHYGPEVDSASKRNEYQEYFLEGKGGRRIGLTTLPPPCAECLEILEFQPPGALRACPGL
jgi:hypothetical protein